MAEKPARSVRLSLEDIARVEGQAKSRGVSQQVILESAIKAWLWEAEHGSAALVLPSKAPSRREVREAHEAARAADKAARAEWAANMAARMAKLNADKERASR